MSTDTVHTKKSPCGVTHNIFTSCSSTASVPSSSTVNASFIFKYSSCSRCSCSSFRRFSSASCQWPQTTTSSLIFIQITHKNCISSVLWWLCPPFTDLCPRYGNLGTLNKSKKICTTYGLWGAPVSTRGALSLWGIWHLSYEMVCLVDFVSLVKIKLLQVKSRLLK